MVLEDYLSRLDTVDRNLTSVLARGVESLAGVPAGSLRPPSAESKHSEGRGEWGRWEWGEQGVNN